MAPKSKKQAVEGEMDCLHQKVSVLENLRAMQDIQTKDLQTIPVARLDFLSSNGKVGNSMEYHSETEFLKALQEELYYGVPLIVVLYRDDSGKTISKKFLEDLCALPKGLIEEDAPKAGKQNRPFGRGDER